MRHVLCVDATGVYRLKDVIKMFANQKTAIILSGVNERVLKDLEKGDIYSVLIHENITGSIEDASARAIQIMEKEIYSLPEPK